jgi:decaprenyl-phosphate phosphoribosyltransferase
MSTAVRDNLSGVALRPLARGIVREARPKQWAKNVLVFAAPGAAGVLLHAGSLGPLLATFALFCLLSSGIYFLNDVLDVEADRQHPTKRLRPVAAGIVPIPVALALGAAAVIGATAAASLVDWRLTVLFTVYVGVQLAYSLALKHQPIYDLACVAAGFVLRAIAGAVAIDIAVSEWFLLVVTFGSLLMVTGKRLGEIELLADKAAEHRATLGMYSATFLRTVTGISAGVAITGYCLWAFDAQSALRPGHDPIFYQLSVVPFAIAILRYSLQIEWGQAAKPEDLVFSDHSLHVLALVWVVLFTLGVYAT